MSIIDSRNVRPSELKPGDVMACTVTVHITHHTDDEGRPMYRAYQCSYPKPQVDRDGIPQGGNLGDQQRQVVEALFPVISYADLNPD